MTNSSRKSHSVAVSLLVAALVAAAPLGAQPSCVGDCQGSGTVQINELIICVGISLGSRPVTSCSSCDSNDNGVVAINELIQAVNSALNGCPNGSTPTPPQATDTPGGPTSTPTATPTTTQPAATATPAADIETVAGTSAAIANAVAAIPNIIGAVLAGVNATQSAAVVSGIPGSGAGGVDPCELGGTVTESGSLPNLTLILDQCRVSRPGGSALFTGTLTVNLTMPLQLRGVASFDALITFFNDSEEVLTQTTADLTADIRLAVQGAPSDPCAVEVPILGDVRITRVDLTNLMGTLDSAVTGEGVSIVTWQGTSVSIAVAGLSEDCVPVDFDVTVNGDATIERQGPSVPVAALGGGVFSVVFDVTFTNFVVSATGDGNESQLDISGDITSSCLGDTVTLSTPQSLSFLLGTFCPSGGTLTVQDIGDIVYSPSGVTVGGETYTSCNDPALLQCVE